MLAIERATAAALEPFGTLIATDRDRKPYIDVAGMSVWQVPFVLEEQSEILICQIDPKPMQIKTIERHFLHTQAYVPMDGKPFVMALAPPTEGDMPDPAAIRAFLFDDARGIALHKDVWHAFPFVLEPATRFAVVLSALSHVLETPGLHPGEGDGRDVQRRNLALRGYALELGPVG